MGRIEVTNPFILLARCTVEYNGRASSILEEGIYLLIRKQDGSFLVHGSEMVPPINYQSAGACTFEENWTITVEGKLETLKIVVYDAIHIYRPQRWSHNKLQIVRTERDLQRKLLNNINQYIPGVEFLELHAEYATIHGPVDIVAIDTTATHHVVEIKRKRITVSAAVQLRKYLDTFREQGLAVLGYLAAPQIAANAVVYCDRNGYKFIAIEHDQVPLDL